MALIGDSGALYALYDRDDANHKAVTSVLEQDRGPIVVPMAILAEIDYLLCEFLGVDAELDFLSSVQSGSYVLEPLTEDDVSRCLELLKQYRDLNLGLADASVAVTAERLAIPRILTVDERDFRAIEIRGDDHLTILPADATSSNADEDNEK